MSKKYRILVESSPVKFGQKHAFVVLQYARADGTFANPREDENAIIYRSGPAEPLVGGPDFNDITKINKMEWVNELNTSTIPDGYHNEQFGNTVTHIGAFKDSSDYNKFYGVKKEGDKPDTSLTLHEVHRGDDFTSAESILEQ